MPFLRPFFEELKRRRVFRAAAAYAVGAWLVMQVADTVFPALGFPDWVLTAVVIVALLGFPVALVLSWAFEVTGGSLRRTESDRATSSGLAIWSFVALVVAATSAAGFFLIRSRAAASDTTRVAAVPIAEASIAVLPFADMSAAQDQAYFADGLAEELLNVLAQMEGLRVAARTSSFALGGPDAPPVTEIGQKLGVATVLEGSVRADRDSVRITAQLIDTRDGMHIWSQTYQRGMADVFAVQDEITRAIANALELRLLGDGTSPRRSRPRDPEAYQAYLRGRYAWNQRTLEGLEESLVHFERAIEIDPGYALGYAGLADAYMILQDFRAIEHEEAFSKGAAAARRALQIDETLAEAHTSLAHILMHQREFEESEREYRRALELNPNLATAHQWYTLLLGLTGRWAEAERHAARAVALDPLAIASTRTRLVVAYMGRDTAATWRRFDVALAKFPNNESLLDWKISAHIAFGQPNDAVPIAEYLAGLYEEGAYYRSLLAVAYAAAGRQDDARRVIARLGERAVPVQVALAFAFMGDMDRAFRELDRAVDEMDPNLDFIGVNPIYDVMRADPRWGEVMRRVGSG